MKVVLGISSAQFTRLVTTPDFPRAKALGLKGRGWIAEDVRKWLRNLPTSRRNVTFEERAHRERGRPLPECETAE